MRTIKARIITCLLCPLFVLISTSFVHSRDLLIGAHLMGYCSSFQYSNTFMNYFREATVQTSWKKTESVEDSYDWSMTDRKINFGISHGLKIFAHALICHSTLPSWISSVGTVKDRLAVADRWVIDFLTRYHGQIWAVSVVNEPLCGPLEDTFGSNYNEHFHQLVRQIDPNIQIFCCENSVEWSCPKSDQFFKLAKSLWKKGLLDGIAFQGHFLEKVSTENMIKTVNRFSVLGPIYFTELTLSYKNSKQQLARFKQLIQAIASCPSVKGIFLWKFWAGETPSWPGAEILRNDFSERALATWLRINSLHCKMVETFYIFSKSMATI